MYLFKKKFYSLIFTKSLRNTSVIFKRPYSQFVDGPIGLFSKTKCTTDKGACRARPYAYGKPSD